MQTSHKFFTLLIASAISAMFIGPALGAAVPATQPAKGDLLPPLAAAPLPATRPTIAPVPYKPYMPPATVVHEPRLLPGDALHPLRARAAIDRPPLGEATPPAPVEAFLPVGPPIRLALADPSAIPVATIAAHPDTGAPTLRTDPTTNMARPSALIVTPPPRTTPPAAQWLAIPDPAHQIGYIPTPSAKTEDRPSADFDRPGPTTLPVAGKQG